MDVISRSILLPEDAWAFLLQWHNATDGWMLPFTQEADTARGSSFLASNNCLLIADAQMGLDIVLEQLSVAILTTRSALTILDGETFYRILFCDEYSFLVRIHNNRRISVSPLSEDIVETMDSFLSAENALCHLHEQQLSPDVDWALWQDVRGLLSDLLNKEAT